MSFQCKKSIKMIIITVSKGKGKEESQLSHYIY